MIVSAVLCPSPPLLAAELSGSDPAAAQLREACSAAVATLVASAPDLIAVVGAADRTETWPEDAKANLSAYGGLARSDVTHPAPLAVGLGALLLDENGYAGPRLLRSVGYDEPLSGCLDLAAEISRSAPRVGLLVMADGTARRTLKAPGYLDERATPFDAEIQRAISDADLAALHALDRDLARELMATGWPALQILAGAFGDRQVSTKVRYADAPFGVGYLVAAINAAKE
ncbi:hypothetical protein HC028_15385 [Planosporangium flavigriseum]|uniref:Uncharacterized protein n=1 Tax=Planosporangium flavigriseum TaxID=373681 RepID=A0A8J3M3C1_9ACTN|nr:hypothetical protein [Planosporangium flavigriseum]NJC65873.1 hypothetical protein [Planosporangium flavigriseum]GIG76080.1 hypothetical protein Pfl04_44840 [Planosporangium flavigriseum]